MTYKLERDKDIYNIVIRFPADEWQNEINAAYAATAHRFSVQGFRAGKAPRGVIEKSYGASVFIEEALNRAIARVYGEIREKHPEVKPVDYLSIKDVKKEDGISIICTVDVEPELVLGKYTGIEVARVKYDVSEQEVDAFLKAEAEQRARLIAAEAGHKVEVGNTVVMDFVGTVGGVAFEGGTGKGYELEIGSKSFIDTFEDQLVGHIVGEDIEVNVKFPDRYHAANLEGKDAKFKVKINNILLKQVPELDDKFAKEASEFATLAEFKTSVKEKLVKQANERAEEESKNALLKAIVDGTKVSVPEKMVDRQLDDLMRDLQSRLSMQGLSMDTYAKYMRTTVEEIRKQHRTAAEGIAKTRLVYDAIIEKENIIPSQSTIDAETVKMAKMSGKKEKDISADKDSMRHIAHSAKMDALLKFLLGNNKIV